MSFFGEGLLYSKLYRRWLFVFGPPDWPSCVRKQSQLLQCAPKHVIAWMETKTTAFAALEVALFPKLWTGVGSVILFHTTWNGAMASWGDHTSALKKSRLTSWEAPAPTKCHLLSSSGLVVLCPRVQLLFSHNRISRWLCGLGNWSSFVFLRRTQLDSSPPDPWMDFASHRRFLAPPKGHSWVQISKTYDSCCIRQQMSLPNKMPAWQEMSSLHRARSKATFKSQKSPLVMEERIQHGQREKKKIDHFVCK